MTQSTKANTTTAILDNNAINQSIKENAYADTSNQGN